MQERRAGSRPALRHPWRVAVRQLVKTFPRRLLVPIPAREPCGGTARLGGGCPWDPPTPILTSDSSPCALRGEVARAGRCHPATLVPTAFATEPVFLLRVCARTEPFPQGLDGFWRLRQSHRKYRRLLGFLSVLAVSHLSGQGGKHRKMIHPTLKNQTKSHRGTSGASGSELNLPVI